MFEEDGPGLTPEAERQAREAARRRHWLRRAKIESAGSWLALGCHALAGLALLALAVLYIVSDRHWLGAALAIWPVWFWAPGLILLTVLGDQTRRALLVAGAFVAGLVVLATLDMLRIALVYWWVWFWAPVVVGVWLILPRAGHGWRTAALLGAIGAFVLLFSEAIYFVRPDDEAARAMFARSHKESFGNPGHGRPAPGGGLPLRIVTWNTGGAGSGAVVAALARQAPDLVFLQEVSGAEAEYGWGVAGPEFSGYDYAAAPDCGLLTRFPVKRRVAHGLPEGYAGALAAELDLPGSRTLTCFNVHMPLYPLRLSIHRGAVRREAREAVRARQAAITNLAREVRAALARGPVIVAGDWNTPAYAGSLRVLRDLLEDAFALAGSGWGNTMTNAFPVSRIDIMYVSSEFEVVHCAAYPAPASDHRIVAAEVWL